MMMLSWWHECRAMGHLLLSIFLHCTAAFMVIPAITGITMGALCPGHDACSQAIFLTGFLQAISGIGTVLITPIIGGLSDEYGRKALLTVPFTVSVVPLAVLAYSKSKPFVYAYFVLDTLAAVVTQGGRHCLTLAYVADNVPEHLRAQAFGVLTGVVSFAFVVGMVTARLLPEFVIFQVAMGVAAFAALYLRVFLVEPKIRSSLPTGRKPECMAESSRISFRTMLIHSRSSMQETARLFKRSLILVQVSIVTFFCNLGESGLQSSLLFYLKARFHFDKDKFANLMLISGVAGAISQLFVMPLLAHRLGEQKLLCVGLFASFAHALLYGVAWSSWVPYVAASGGVLAIFISPCVGSIVSREAGSEEQGKIQGCISSIRSFATIISPLAMSPLTALFLSKKAPFECPGFAILCVAFAMMIAFIQGCMMRPPPTIVGHIVSDYVQVLSVEDGEEHRR